MKLEIGAKLWRRIGLKNSIPARGTRQAHEAAAAAADDDLGPPND